MSRGHNVFCKPVPQVIPATAEPFAIANDMFLHALFARVGHTFRFDVYLIAMWPFNKKSKESTIKIYVNGEAPKPQKRYYTREEEHQALCSIRFCDECGGCMGMSDACDNCGPKNKTI